MSGSGLVTKINVIARAESDGGEEDRDRVPTVARLGVSHWPLVT